MFVNEEQKKREDIRNERYELVVKSNELLRNTRYTLNTTEQKLLVYIISMIKQDDKEFKEVEINILDYCKLAGIETNSGNIYQYIKDQIQILANKSWWIPVNNKKEILFRWIDKASIEKGSGIIKIKLHDNLKPYLLDIRSNFTKYELINVLTLRSKYAIRLYELFKSYLWQGHWEIDVEELKSLLNVSDKYKQFKEFRRSLLLPAVSEINEYTDLSVEFKPIKQGKATKEIHFSIGEKQGYQLGMDLMFNRKDRLG